MRSFWQELKNCREVHGDSYLQPYWRNMKSFITEIETGAGNFIGSEYPFKKAVKNGRITTVSYRGRRDAPDMICSIDRINNTTLNLKVTLENKTANAIVIRLSLIHI